MPGRNPAENRPHGRHRWLSFPKCAILTTLNEDVRTALSWLLGLVCLRWGAMCTRGQPSHLARGRPGLGAYGQEADDFESSPEDQREQVVTCRRQLAIGSRS